MVHVIACPGASLIKRGVIPFHRAATPSSAATVRMQCTKPLYRDTSPPRFSYACNRLLATSRGQLVNGPMVDDTSPVTKGFHAACCTPSPSTLPKTCLERYANAMKLNAWFEPYRSMVGATPFHKARGPSSFTIVVAA